LRGFEWLALVLDELELTLRFFVGERSHFECIEKLRRF
jgi:hypothetical protein